VTQLARHECHQTIQKRSRHRRIYRQCRRRAKICSFVAHSVVEVQTHPLHPREYAFLTQDGFHWLMWVKP